MRSCWRHSLSVIPKRCSFCSQSISSYYVKYKIFTRNLCLHHRQYYTTGHSFGNDKAKIADALNISENLMSSVLGTQVHAHIIKLGFSDDIFSQNNLIKMYSKCGSLGDGIKAFNEMPKRNLVSWTLIISGALQNGDYEMALETYLDMIRDGLMPNEFTMGSVIKVCTRMEAYELGSCMHCFALKIELVENPFVCCSLLHMYARCGRIEAAERLFKSMNDSDVGCWNAMIGGYVHCGYGVQAAKAVSLMHSEGIFMDEFTVVSALAGCSIMRSLGLGKQIHGMLAKKGMKLGNPVINALMDMYFKNGQTELAFKLFDSIQHKDVVSWNIVFGGSAQDADATEVVCLFHNFMLSGLRPNHGTLSILIRFCGKLLNLVLGLQFYCLAFRFGLYGEVYVTSSLINMFCRCGATEVARLVFDLVPSKGILIWNEMISGYNVNSDVQALKVFLTLWKLGVEANEYTFSSALEACFKTENLQMSRQIHAIVIKHGVASNMYICSSIIKAYVSFRLLDDSFEFLNCPGDLDTEIISIMISGLVHQGHHFEAIKIFNYLKQDGEEADEFVLGSILNGCASIASHHLTRSVHSVVTKMGFEMHAFVASAIIDAYAKCGDIGGGKMVFYQSSKSADVVLFNTMIMAYTHHGLVKEAMEMFDMMKLAGLKPSQSTFVSVISACSHMGLVDLGRSLFRSIILDYGMEPSPDNYGCLVDLLSRHGFLLEAKYVIDLMPFQPWPAIWRSLLNGCRIHGERELGEFAAKRLIQLVPDNAAAYVLLSKVYSEIGDWEDAVKVRSTMIDRGVQKNIGCSWIEIR